MSSVPNINSSNLSQKVEASYEDINVMKEKLDKLKNLKESEKNDTAILRSRIDEQSQLIMILKQRSDDAVSRTKTLEKMVDELTEFRDSVKDDLQREYSKYNLLDGRFNDLAYNHQEMIKFKDEYKRQNKELRDENERLKNENAKLFSDAIEQKNFKIKQLNNEINDMQDKLASLDFQFQDVNKLLSASKLKHSKEIQELKNINFDLAENLSKEEKLRKHLEEKLNKLEDQAKFNGNNSNSTIERLEKEKGDMLKLAMQRGRLVQDKVEEIKRLHQKIEDVEKKLKLARDKFEQEAAAVNSNILVIKLKDDLEDTLVSKRELEQNFRAFKEHSKKLLENEKDINAKLRMLLS